MQQAQPFGAVLTPCHRNGLAMIGRERNGIDRAIEPTQMTDLAILLMQDFGMASSGIHAQHIRGAYFDTGFAANTALNLCHWHIRLPLYLKE